MTSPVPCRSVRLVPDAATAAESVAVASAMRRPGRRTSLSSSSATWRSVRASTVRGRMLRSAAAAVSAVSPRGQPGRDELGEQGMQPVDGLRPRADQIIAMFGQGTQGRDGLIDNSGVEPGGSVRGDANPQGVGLIGFAAVAGGQHPDAAGELGGHVNYGDAIGPHRELPIRRPGSRRRWVELAD